MQFDLQREMRAYGRQKDIAEKLGVSVARISAMYTGIKPPTDNLLNLLGWKKVKTEKFVRIK